MWGRDPVPWKVSPDTQNYGTLAQTDDIRPGLTWQGLITLQNFVKQGGVFVASDELHRPGPVVRAHARGRPRTPSPRARRSRTGCRCARGWRTRPVRSRTALRGQPQQVFSNDGQSFSVNSRRRWTRAWRRTRAAACTARRGRGKAGSIKRSFRTAGLRAPPCPPSGDQDQNRGQAPPMPAELRPRTILRFAAQAQLLVSGLLNGGWRST